MFSFNHRYIFNVGPKRSLQFSFPCLKMQYIRCPHILQTCKLIKCNFLTPKSHTICNGREKFGVEDNCPSILSLTEGDLSPFSSQIVWLEQNINKHDVQQNPLIILDLKTNNVWNLISITLITSQEKLTKPEKQFPYYTALVINKPKIAFSNNKRASSSS